LILISLLPVLVESDSQALSLPPLPVGLLSGLIEGQPVWGGVAFSLSRQIQKELVDATIALLARPVLVDATDYFPWTLPWSEAGILNRLDDAVSDLSIQFRDGLLDLLTSLGRHLCSPP